jgi:hypothetical protein
MGEWQRPKIIRNFASFFFEKVPRWSRESFQNSSHFEEESYEIVKILFLEDLGRFLALFFIWNHHI